MRSYLPAFRIGLILGGLAAISVRADAGEVSVPVPEVLKVDWAMQERRLGREPGSPESICEALGRLGRVVDELGRQQLISAAEPAKEALTRLREETGRLNSLSNEDRLALYHRTRSAARDLALERLKLADTPIVFVKQRRFVCQMLHEYVGYYYNYGDIAGGGVFVLDQPGRSASPRDLLAGRLPRGSFTTPALSYDGRTVYFAFCEVSDAPRPDGPFHDWRRLPPAGQVVSDFNYFSPARRCFHIYAVDTDGSNLRQVTKGNDDEFNPCPLPDGGIAFLSSHRGGYGRCNNDFEPLPTYTLHRADADGQNVRTLSFHETNEWHPAVLNDGRIVYSRWDYVDRSAAHYHGLWACNPDGTNPLALFGSYTQRISACYQPQPVPGSDKILFIAGAHHANVGGSLVLFDPSRAKLSPKTGEDELGAIDRLSPEVCFPEAEGWPRSYFNSPWPLSENAYLVAFSFDPLPSMAPGHQGDSQAGIYYFDRFGTLELIYRDSDLSCTGPIPMRRRPVPPIIPSTLDPSLGDEGELVVSNASWSLQPFPAGRAMRKIRVFQILLKSTSHVANQPRLGYANAEGARMLLGEVPVEADGSAYLRVPARKPLYFQAVDDRGHAIQTMRSITYLQPGERKSCVGCHAPAGAAPGPQVNLLATRHGPSPLEPGPDGTRPYSFPRLVQPVLDRHCVRCHSPATAPAAGRLDLSRTRSGSFSRSYESLRPFVRWYEWGGESITETVTIPGHAGADESRLLKVLDDPTHSIAVKLPPEDRRRLVLWLDGNAPFYGSYEPADQEAQRAGKAVEPASLQ